MNNMGRSPIFLLQAVLASCSLGSSLSANAQLDEYRYRQTGSGKPVVVFENGLGDRLETWKSVQDDVSRFTETFAYNRAGYSGGPSAGGTRDAATVVSELRALLAERRLSPPYLLVGHSLGGLYMQYYARNFPEEVAGLVLVDSMHWEQSERMRSGGVRAERGLLGIAREEYAASELSQREVRDSPPLRPMPLIVLTAGQQPSAVWHELQRELAAQLPGTRHTIAERSGHFIQQRQPQFVWAAVRDIVVALRGQ